MLRAFPGLWGDFEVACELGLVAPFALAQAANWVLALIEDFPVF